MIHDIISNQVWVLIVAPTLFCCIFTVCIRKVCEYTNTLSNPIARSSHATPIARLGGVAIFSTFVVFGISTIPTFVLVAAGILFVVGFIDDIYNLKPKYKLIGQSISCLILVTNDVYLPLPYIPSEISQMICFVWFISLLNAINFIDGLDGLLSGYSIISLVSILICVSLIGNSIDVRPIYILLFCIIGFLLFNAHPANIFMGDGGSLSIGTLLIYFVVTSMSSTDGNLQWLLPIILLCFPMIDICNVILQRIYNHQPIFGADKRHIHHMIQRSIKRESHTETVVLLYILMAILSVGFPIIIILN